MINDLKLAVVVIYYLMLEANAINLKHMHLALFCDNTSVVAWAYKMRNSQSIVTGYLLRFLGLSIHQSQVSSAIPHHISGEKNIMADVISRAFKRGQYFTVSQILNS